LALTALNLLNQAGTERARLPVWVGAVLLIVVAAVTWRLPRRLPALIWPMVPTFGVVTIVTLDLLTHDATAGGQIWFCWPVLYAAYLLRPPVAWLVCAEVVAGEILISFRLTPQSEAIDSAISIAVTMVLMTVVLVAVRTRVDVAMRRVSELANVDALTGLANRRFFDDRVSAVCAAASQPVSLLAIDLDGFKQVNDTHGHGVGDRVLSQVADLLRQHCRPGDTVGRRGGDELAMMLPGCDAAAAARMAERLRAAAATTPIALPDGNAVQVTLSIGIATTTTATSDVPVLIETADRALYEAKRAGRNRVVGTAGGLATPTGPPTAETALNHPTGQPPADPGVNAVAVVQLASPAA
jgi:diguanylate cyclase (GGDEF)-like protein